MALVEKFVASGCPLDDATLHDALLRDISQAAPLVRLDRDWLVRALERTSRPRPRTRTPEQWAACFPRYPTDEQGFAHAFAPGAGDEIRATLDRLGIVVVRVFDRSRCSATVDAMFEEINAMPTELARGSRPRSDAKATDKREPIRVDAPATWATSNWPSPSKFLIPRPAFHRQAFANRIDPVLHQVFSAIWGDDRLRVTIDNWGAHRGTRGLVLSPGAAPEERPKWASAIGPHWDYNPWLWLQERSQGRNPGYQGLVALVDQPPGSGCHRTLPGCTRFLEHWCSEHEQPKSIGFRRSSHRPQLRDPIVAWMQEIPLRAGDIVIWSWGQLHGSAPNESARLRLHQYIRMFPAAEHDPFYEHHDRYAPARILHQHADRCTREQLASFNLDHRERRLLGLDPWPSENQPA